MIHIDMTGSPVVYTPGMCAVSAGSLKVVPSVSQSVSYFTVPPRAHPSTGSQSVAVEIKRTHPT